MEEMFEKWGKKMENLVSQTRDSGSGKGHVGGIDRGSSGVQQISIGDSSGSGQQRKVDCLPLVQEPESQNTTLETFRVNARKSKIECPRFDGHDFFGWPLKVEQYFEAMGLSNDEKVQTIMIHLDGKAL